MIDADKRWSVTMDKELFEHRVKALWPRVIIHKTISTNPEAHLALVSIGEHGRPFFVGLKHGMPSPVDTRTVHATRQHYKEIVHRLDGIMELMRVLTPSEPRDWTAFNKLVGIDQKDTATD